MAPHGALFNQHSKGAAQGLDHGAGHGASGLVSYDKPSSMESASSAKASKSAALAPDLAPFEHHHASASAPSSEHHQDNTMATGVASLQHNKAVSCMRVDGLLECQYLGI
ncbi:unnamed protein product [Calypogeia fissa]